ncbi:hypothetical protein [Streptacidiphilus carbonis]|uniref:hypothetical protein n=1 Tax=Streptacidiphilus carbonis TaxID=105422 RepID=UPI0005AAA2DA|nr:hypothetical protein [Streptacidiphilus carbonis]
MTATAPVARRPRIPRQSPLKRTAARPVSALRAAAPALLGYCAVRALGVLMLLAVGADRRRPVLKRVGGLWDAGWYVRVIEHGYTSADGLVGRHGIPYSPRAFFPLFPWLGEAVRTVLPVSAGTALVLVSSVSGIGAAWGGYAVARICHGERTGVVVAVLWGVLPLAVLENTAYSEALFSCIAVWTLYAVLTRRWLLAGVLCLLAGLSRPSAMALTAAVCAAAAVELYRCLRGSGSAHWWRPLAAALLSPLGWAGYILYVGRAEHSWGAYFRLQQAWGSSFDGGLSTLKWFDQVFLSHRAAEGIPLAYAVMALSVFGYLLLFAIALLHRQPLVLLVFSAALLVIDLGNASPYPPLARFLMPAIPLLFPLAVSVSRLRSRATVLVVLGAAALVSGLYGAFVVFYGGAPS